jgi:starch synthase
MKIVEVASEVAPFSKTGGLGDVTGALSKALAARGHRVVTVSPGYGHLHGARAGAKPTGAWVWLHAAGHRFEIAFDRLDRDGVTHLFLRNGVFDRNGIYGDANGTFGDNHLRYLLLAHAALEAARRLPLDDGEPLGEDVLFHGHDWQAAILPILLDAKYRPLGVFPRSPTVLTLHNLAHQGRFPVERFAELELPPSWFHPEALEFHGHLNYLKAGILNADRLTTVSPSYAFEILHDDGSAGLGGAIRHRARDLTGILNGIDDTVWNPSIDPHLEATFSADDLTGKARCKGALQAELGLPVDPSAPLVGFIGRLDPQKGIELLVESIPWLVQDQRAQVVLLGSADPAHQRYEGWLRELEHRFGRHVRAWIGYSEAVAHRIEAGADLFAMPSRFEPCGLNQLYSLRYGTPPVVHAVGGLRDSVEPADRTGASGTGWKFDRFDGYAFRNALWHAIDTWRNHQDAFRAIQLRGMRQDLSWDARVGTYEAVFRDVWRRRGVADP